MMPCNFCFLATNNISVKQNNLTFMKTKESSAQEEEYQNTTAAITQAAKVIPLPSQKPHDNSFSTAGLTSEPLNIQNLRLCKGYEQLCDEGANELVISLKTFAEILYASVTNKNNIIDNQQVVYLNKQKKAA